MSIKSLIVSPPSIALSLHPNETYTGELTVVNPSDSTSDMDFVAEITPYSIANTDYSADFSSETTYTSIAKWATLDQSTGTLAPGASATIKYTINVPEDAPAGGQYCTISVRSTNSASTDSSVINESFAIASIIFARVSGEVNESGEILNIHTPAIVFTPPVQTTLELSNTGNIHLNATVTTKITSFFTGERLSSTPEGSSQTETVMPGTTRLATYTYDDFPELGLFNLTQEVTYAGTVRTESHLVFVCPIWFMILSLATITAIFSLLISKIIKKKHKNISQ